MRIKRVKIKNFRTLYDVTIDFHNITTFIGPNGSGNQRCYMRQIGFSTDQKMEN